MHPSTSLFITAVTLGLSSVTYAVCTGNTIAVGTPTTSSTGTTVWNIYDTSCNVLNTYSQDSAVSVCDSAVFYCTFGTTLIDQYDDPQTGWAYNCTTDATVEACGTDTIISCVSFFPRPQLPKGSIFVKQKEGKWKEMRHSRHLQLTPTNHPGLSVLGTSTRHRPGGILDWISRLCLFCMNRMGILGGQGAIKWDHLRVMDNSTALGQPCLCLSSPGMHRKFYKIARDMRDRR